MYHWWNLTFLSLIASIPGFEIETTAAIILLHYFKSWKMMSAGSWHLLLNVESDADFLVNRNKSRAAGHGGLYHEGTTGRKGQRGQGTQKINFLSCVSISTNHPNYIIIESIYYVLILSWEWPNWCMKWNQSPVPLAYYMSCM